MNYEKEEHIVVLYHYISPKEQKFKGITPKKFREHLEFLNNKYVAITTQDLIDYVHGKTKLESKTYCITFDDGLKCQYKYAYPILKDMGLPATFFVSSATLKGYLCPVHKIHLLLSSEPPERIGVRFSKITGISIPKDRRLDKKKKWDDNFTTNLKMHLRQNPEVLNTIFTDVYGEKQVDHYMDVGEIKKISEDNMIIGSHGVKHEHLGLLGEEEQEEELRESKKQLSKIIGKEVTQISYPSGSFNKKTIEIANELGYTGGFTVLTERNTQATFPLKINRIDANDVEKQL